MTLIAVCRFSRNLLLACVPPPTHSSMQTPGISWRCDILPPSAAIEAAAMGNPARAAALLMRRTKQAVLRVRACVTLPSPPFHSLCPSLSRRPSLASYHSHPPLSASHVMPGTFPPSNSFQPHSWMWRCRRPARAAWPPASW